MKHSSIWYKHINTYEESKKIQLDLYHIPKTHSVFGEAVNKGYRCIVSVVKVIEVNSDTGIAKVEHLQHLADIILSCTTKFSKKGIEVAITEIIKDEEDILNSLSDAQLIIRHNDTWLTN